MALQDNQSAMVGVPLALLLASMIVVAARFYTRWTRKTWGLDDWFIGLGLLFYVFQTVTTIGSGLNGIGLQTEHITSNEQYILGGKVSYILDSKSSL